MNERQITLNSKLLRGASGSRLNAPFEQVTLFVDNVIGNSGAPEMQVAYESFINACTAFALEMIKENRSLDVPSRANHLAIGRNTSSGGYEDTYVEYIHGQGDEMQIARYEPGNGMVKVSIVGSTGLKLYYLKAPSGLNDADGTVIWLSVLPILLTDEEFAKRFADFETLVFDVATSYATANQVWLQDLNSRFAKEALPLCKRLKELVIEEESIKLLVPEDTVAFLGFRAGDISRGVIGPSMAKNVIGNFQYFKPAGSTTSRKKKSYSKAEVKKNVCSKMKWVNPCNTPMEQALIPETDGIVTPQIVDMVTELVETQENPLATRKRFFLIEGPAGVGKSFNARMFAELNERPFVVQTLSPTDQKEDLIGGIVPITKGQSEDVADIIDLSDEEKAALKAINESDESSTYENVAAALGYPSYDLCRMDPEGSYEAITGQTLEQGQTVSIPSVIALVNRKVLNAVVSINNKCKENAGKIKNAKEEQIISNLKKVRAEALTILTKAGTGSQEEQESLKNQYEALVSDEKVCSYPPLAFEIIVSLFNKNPEMAMPYIPGYNGNREDFLPKYEKETEIEYKFIPSPFVRAFQNGWVCELQEATCLLNPSALSGLHDALEPESMGVIITPYGEIRRHPDFVCIATQNRKYPGTKPLNPATRSRFQYFDCPDNLSKTAIMSRIQDKCKITDRDLLKDIAEVFTHLEECAREERLSGEMTMRAVFNFADALNRGKDVEFARNHYALWAVSTDEEDVAVLNNSISDCQGRA